MRCLVMALLGLALTAPRVVDAQTFDLAKPSESIVSPRVTR